MAGLAAPTGCSMLVRSMAGAGAAGVVLGQQLAEADGVHTAPFDKSARGEQIFGEQPEFLAEVAALRCLIPSLFLRFNMLPCNTWPNTWCRITLVRPPAMRCSPGRKKCHLDELEEGRARLDAERHRIACQRMEQLGQTVEEHFPRQDAAQDPVGRRWALLE